MANVFSIAATSEPEVATSGTRTMTGLFGLMVLIGVSSGLYAFYAGHHEMYNNTREMPWGVLISTYAFFAITSTGLCLLAAISHIFGGNKMAPLANRMVWLSLITIIAGFTLIGLELERPWRMAIYNVISPNPTSNIWWMGTLYGMAVGKLRFRGKLGLFFIFLVLCFLLLQSYLIYSFEKSFLLSSLLSFLVVLALAYPILKFVTQPIQALTDLANRVASGRLDQGVPAESDDELGRLSKAINEMSVQLQSKIEEISREKDYLQTLLSGIMEGVLVVTLGAGS